MMDWNALVVFVLWVGLSIGVARVAEQRGRDKGKWFLASLLISPVLALLFLVAKPLPETPSVAEHKRIPCKQCAEMIQPGAKICRFCGAERT